MLWKARFPSCKRYVFLFAFFVRSNFSWLVSDVISLLSIALKVVSRIVALEELVRPMKNTMTELHHQVLGLSSSIRQISEKQAELESSDVQTSAYVEPQAHQPADYVTEVLTDLDQSLDNGEIDMEQYSASLRYVLGTDGKMRAAPLGMPIMSSTPQPQRKLVYDPPVAAPIVSHVSDIVERSVPQTKREIGATAVMSYDTKKTTTYEKTPIKKLASTSISVASLSIHPSAPMAVSYNPKSALTTPQHIAKREENRVDNFAHPVALSVQASAQKSSAIISQPQMEAIIPEEKANVQFWLGLDMAELNRSIATLNQCVDSHLKKSNLAPSESISFTVDDVAAYCNIDAKKAKAVVLLLCNLKRLKLIRGEITSYSILGGNTIRAK